MITFECPKFESAAETEAYLEKLSSGSRAIQCGIQTICNLAVIFGPREEDRPFLTDQGMILCAWLHEYYLRGEWRPRPGSSFAFGVLIIEDIAGGIPDPSRRDEISAIMVRRLFGMLKKKPEEKQGFVPLGNDDEKRRAALDLLNDIAPEVT